jgi:type I restriction enzyme S subunit
MANTVVKYQKYAEYKDSGVEWLGEIPKGWEVLKLKYALDLISEKSQDNNQKYVGMENIASKNGKYVHTEDVIPEGISSTFKENDVLFGKLRPYLAKSWLASFSGICSSELLVLRAKEVCPKFLQYYTLTDEFINQVDSSTYGSKMPRASWDFISLLPIPKCSYELSLKIANFLDHETAKIDSLIAKQEKLIELLKEKRQAVISHAVTKGLNSDVAMKNSGVEWLGQVPEHWKVMQFRRITSLSQGLQIPQSERLHEPNDNTVEYITIKSLNAKDDAYKEYIYKASDRVTCDKSDVLLARTGATGEVVTNVSGAFHNNFFKVSYSNDILRDFLVYILKVKELKSHLLMLAGTTTIPDLNHGAFLGTQIALPSLTEQQEIIDFIDDYLRRSMILEGKARSAIQLMQERRTALISSAVTGKIDVRNWQHPNKNNEAKTEFGA